MTCCKQPRLETELLAYVAPERRRCQFVDEKQLQAAACMAAAQPARTSVMGVSRTRSAPYFCSSPLVILYAPWYSPTCSRAKELAAAGRYEPC